MSLSYIFPTQPDLNNRIFWRLDREEFKDTTLSGEGAFLYGGRWNRPKFRMVYASFDAATAILETAVAGVRKLNTVPRVLTWYEINASVNIYCVSDTDISNPIWSYPALKSSGQQERGELLTTTHQFVAVPSVTTRHTWNLIFNPDNCTGLIKQIGQETYSCDARLDPAV